MKGWHIIAFVAVALTFVFLFRPPNPTEEHLRTVQHPGLGIEIQIPKDADFQTFPESLNIQLKADSNETRRFSIFRPHFPKDSLTPAHFPMTRELNPSVTLQFGAWIEEEKSRRDYRHAGFWIHQQDTLFLDAHWQEEYLLFDGSKARRTEFSFYFLSKLQYRQFDRK